MRFFYEKQSIFFCAIEFFPSEKRFFLRRKRCFYQKQYIFGQRARIPGRGSLLFFRKKRFFRDALTSRAEKCAFFGIKCVFSRASALFPNKKRILRKKKSISAAKNPLHFRDESALIRASMRFFLFGQYIPGQKQCISGPRARILGPGCA